VDLRFSTALQMVLSVALSEKAGCRCTSQLLAQGLGTNPSFIRQLLVPLTGDGIVRPSVGKNGGIRLARPAETITLRDVYGSITGGKPVLEARRDLRACCPVSTHMNTFFATVAQEAEEAMLCALARRTVADSLIELLTVGVEKPRA
jgi:Rrf2 family transcriptional repressor of oqxAB